MVQWNHKMEVAGLILVMPGLVFAAILFLITLGWSAWVILLLVAILLIAILLFRQFRKK